MNRLDQLRLDVPFACSYSHNLLMLVRHFEMNSSLLYAHNRLCTSWNLLYVPQPRPHAQAHNFYTTKLYIGIKIGVLGL